MNAENLEPGSLISGIHHVTACPDSIQEDVEFNTKVLGLRLIKRTVILDGEQGFYHLYYGDETGTPGTVWTGFPYKRSGVTGRKGTGQVKVTSYSVPSASLDFWVDRFDRYGVKHGGIEERFGQSFVRFEDPSGLEFEMVGDDDDQRTLWVTEEISTDEAVRGFHSVTLSLRETAEPERFMEMVGFRKTAEEGPYTRFEVQEGGAARTVDFLHEPDVPQGSWIFGTGTVHHVAFAVADDEANLAMKAHLEGLGYTDVSDLKDRNYFHSTYTRMPGGVLFEMATSDIGFVHDEPVESLGQRLMLPSWFEDQREEIEAKLETLPAETTA